MSENPPVLNISRLDRYHDRTTFNCGKEKLNNYIRNLAWQHEKRDIGRTFIMTEKGMAKVLGFYTLVASCVAFEHMPEGEKVAKYPVPVLKLAQLAIEQSCQKQSLGEYLLFDALARAERISKDAAVFAVEVDALDEEAISFYTRYDFKSMKDDKYHLYLPMKHIAKLSLNE